MLQTTEIPMNSFYTSVDSKELLVGDTSTPNNFIYKEIFDYNIYTKIPEMKIKCGDTVLDIGAHIGIFSRYAAIQGADKVIAFEMNPEHFICLRKNVRLEDDIFNCVVLDKNLSKFKLENDVLVNGFDLDHFFYGGLFKNVDFMKIDIMGKEQNLLKSITPNIYNITNKISVRLYYLTDPDKANVVDLMKKNGFHNFFNIIIPNQPIQFLYFWK